MKIIFHRSLKALCRAAIFLILCHVVLYSLGSATFILERTVHSRQFPMGDSWETYHRFRDFERKVGLGMLIDSIEFLFGVGYEFDYGLATLEAQMEFERNPEKFLFQSD